MITAEQEAEMQAERVVQLRAQYPDGNHPELRAIDGPLPDVDDLRSDVERVAIEGDTLTTLEPKKSGKGKIVHDSDLEQRLKP